MVKQEIIFHENIMLNLERPLIFFDLETTGVFPLTSRIVQIAAVKLFPNGDVIEKNKYIHPECQIPYESTRIHGIDDSMVKDSPKFKEISKSFFEFINDSDYCGFNSRHFDLPFLRNEFERYNIEFNYLDKIDIDVYILERAVRKKVGSQYRYNENISLSDLYYYYTNHLFKNAHNALNDVHATMDVFDGQLLRLEMGGCSIEDINAFTPNKAKDYRKSTWFKEIDEIMCWGFGKHKDKPVTNDYNYGVWFVNNERFPINEREIISDKLDINIQVL